MSSLRLTFDAASWRPGRIVLHAFVDGQTQPVTVDVSARNLTLPFADNAFDAVECADVIRYLTEPLAFMQELHRTAAPNASATFVLHDASGDEAHSSAYLTRPYTANAFSYFGQPAYHRADYGYRGDWEIVEIIYLVAKPRFDGVAQAEVRRAIARERNATLGFYVALRAHKPIRKPADELRMIDPQIVLA